jgi:hypothetical protein
MFAHLQHALTSPRTGPAATALALVLALALAATWSSAQRTQAELEGRVERLSVQAQSVGAYWRARVAACESLGGRDAAEAPRPWLVRRTDGTIARAAAELASRPPPGFDACARMESADAAVLGTLR